MSRTAWYKLYYFSILGVPVVIAFCWWHFHLSIGWLIAAMMLLVVPGKILGYFWRDLLRGLRLLQEKRYEESIHYSQAFLDEFARRPWIRHFIWLGSSSYSRNPRSLACNNLGAAELKLGNLDSARAHLEEAIREDDLNPLPFYNLAALARMQKNAEEAVQMTNAAVARGLTFGITDKVVMASQKRFAKREGQGGAA